jgi:hypothetical protein
MAGKMKPARLRKLKPNDALMVLLAIRYQGRLAELPETAWEALMESINDQTKPDETRRKNRRG